MIMKVIIVNSINLSVNLTQMTSDELFALDKECKKMLKDYKRIFRNIIYRYIPRGIVSLVKLPIKKLRGILYG